MACLTKCYLPYSNDFLEISFEGSYHVLAKIKLRVPRQWVCRRNNRKYHAILVIASFKQRQSNQQTFFIYDHITYHNEAQAQCSIICFGDRPIELLEKRMLERKQLRILYCLCLCFLDQLY